VEQARDLGEGNPEIKVADPQAWGQCGRPVTHSWERRLIHKLQKTRNRLVKIHYDTNKEKKNNNFGTQDQLKQLLNCKRP
jgi:hypothetical protein